MINDNRKKKIIHFSIVVLLILGFYLFLGINLIEKYILFFLNLFSFEVPYSKIRLGICISLGILLLGTELLSEIQIHKESISKDKQFAMYPRIPRKYISKQPNDFTVGKYRNRYFRIPIDVNDIKHTLIIGAPGSFKSSTLLNILIWNFNFEKEKKPMTVFALDVKPELSRKSIDESRTDLKIINPSINTGSGFDVWYGLNQDSSDDRLIERADLIARTLITNTS